MFSITALVVIGLLAVVLLLWFVKSEFKHKRKLAIQENALAVCTCPSCSRVIGAEVAHHARIGKFRLLEDIGELFGSWVVRCGHCSVDLLYDPGSHEFRIIKAG